MRSVIAHLSDNTDVSKWKCPIKLAWGIVVCLMLTVGIASANEFTLARHQVGGLLLGMSAEEVYKIYPKELTKQIRISNEDESMPAIQVFRTASKQTLSLVIVLDAKNGKVVYVDVRDPRFKTASGIGVGSSLGELRKAQKVSFIGPGERSFIEGSEGDDFNARVDDLNMLFVFQRLDEQTLKRIIASGNQNDNMDNPVPLIPDQTTIKRILVDEWENGQL
jgi:hypothetical protein